MAGILSGLKGLGLEELENLDLYKDEEKKPADRNAQKRVIAEKDLVYDKSFCCPVCDKKFTSKVMKTGKTRLLSTELDSRLIYEGIDIRKYEVVQCPDCGYGAMISGFQPLLSSQVKMVRENICNKVHFVVPTGEIYEYEEVIPRYQIALACAIVKHAKDSEKAHICLHFAWLLRGYAEALEAEDKLTFEKAAELKEQEQECLQKAVEGFINARQKESFPICGMDPNSFDYVLAAIAYEVGNNKVAAKLVSELLVSSTANNRMKDKARDLKQLILERYKK
jgi:uncharacterized protein (DUF2225 family)